jgi:protein-S-isoprenylcysteine O-methyltransferase Ste14
MFDYLSSLFSSLLPSPCGGEAFVWLCRFATAAFPLVIAIRAGLNRFWYKQEPQEEASRYGMYVTGAFYATMWALLAVGIFFPHHMGFVVKGKPIDCAVRYLGAGLALASAVGLNWAFNALGTNWAPGIQQVHQQELVTSGPYEYVRHPMYSLAMLYMESVLMMINHESRFLIGLFLGVTILLLLRIPAEDRFLLGLFKNDYVDYRDKTHALVPGKIIRGLYDPGIDEEHAHLCVGSAKRPATTTRAGRVNASAVKE